MFADEGWLQRAVDVNGQLHIIEELQLFEEPQPVDSIVISQKQVSLLKQKDIACNNKIDVILIYVVDSPLDECVCGLTLWCCAAALVHMSQIHVLL